MAVTYREIRIETNNFARVHIFPVRPVSRGRKSKNKPTRATQERLNHKNKIHRLTDVINLNFDEQDYFYTFDYHLFREKNGREPTDEEITRELNNFLRRAKRAYGRCGKELKYVLCTERGRKSGLTHHHVVMNACLTREEMRALWKCGGVHDEHLRFDEYGARGLSEYMVKDKKKIKSYSCSRNLRRPEEKKEIFINDHRITQKRFNAISSNDFDEIHKLYPDWQIASLPDMEYAIDYDTGEIRDARMHPFLTLYLYRSEGLSKNRNGGKRNGEA